MNKKPDCRDIAVQGSVLSLDLEVSRSDGVIRKFAAIRTDSNQSLVHSGGDLAKALAKLDRFARGASFLLGHNIIAFDLPRLSAAKPDSWLLGLPVIDTLRLNPLAFPGNPYHRLVKHYKDGAIKRGKPNDPELDARLALEIFKDQQEKLKKSAPNLLKAWHWLTTPDPDGRDRATDGLFSYLRGQCRPSLDVAKAAVRSRLEGEACSTYSRDILDNAGKSSWALAYTLAWLSVAGGNSVMPPWVRHQFPEAGHLVRRLRDNACTDHACSWCRKHHDARKVLARWFGFHGFRSEPRDREGRPMQQSIVEAAMAGRHVLGILPTGTGKSLCYQIPALSRNFKTGSLTVVISPLVALMADQVSGMEKHRIDSCVTINGLLSMPERSDALDRVRLGDASILIISPEQLRSRTVLRALEQREIGGWVIDEAHCISRWGHDFRPDYRYVGRFIKKRAGSSPVPPTLFLTGTAKPDVKKDICRHFREVLGIDLLVFDGGAERSNLKFDVIPTSGEEKFAHLHMLLARYLPEDVSGGAIVYCATRSQSEDVAMFLREKDVASEHFHAGLSPERKKEVQQRFVAGELRTIVATNAFGMGINKPDVRLVIHADIPGSLENYLQEAGRAGRDGEPAHCLLMYTRDDVERQFGMSARSRLTRREIHGILRALRNLDRKKRFDGEVVATTGEILGEDHESAFQRDSATDDTRVRTAVSWLEEAEFLSREENIVQVFPSSLRVSSVSEVRAKLEKESLEPTYSGQLLRIAELLIDADADDGISTDELMVVSGLSSERVRGALYDLEQLGIASNDTALTAFVHAGVKHSSQKRLEESEDLESTLIQHMREAAPDLGNGDTSLLHLRVAAQVLRDKGLSDPLPERLLRILRSVAYDGRGEDGDPGSLALLKLDAETVRVTLRREWKLVEKTAQVRREAARHLLTHLLACVPTGIRGTDLLAETTIGNLTRSIESDMILKNQIKSVDKLLARALLWLHEQEVIRLNKGLAVFRPAMTIRLAQRDQRGFAQADFEPLSLHYKGQVLQIHVMAEFAERGLAEMSEAMSLAMDYFALQEEKFLDQWLPGRDMEIGRETTPDSWQRIVDDLRNPIQRRIVADNREKTNVLVLAGPGSGKTRVLVHRIAYLIRARRENPRGILALAYNRHAAVEIRRRLQNLVGSDARGATVLTCHALAMRLAGESFTGRLERPGSEAFDEVIRRAVDLLNGRGLPPDDADERRERILSGFRWILVDEYQDIDQDQYDLISALAGRTIKDEAGKLSVFAVGDDDQNIYSFSGASVRFVRRFEEDYQARPFYLTDNYRSTAHIVSAANAVIKPAKERMKSDHPIHVNRARAKDPWGGSWEKLDPVGRGRVQVLPAGRDLVSQARAVVGELQRLASLSPGWDWSRCAVIARQWKNLVPVRACCEMQDISAQVGNEEIPSFWYLRETRALVEWLRGRQPRLVDARALRDWIDGGHANLWHDLLRQAVDEFVLEAGKSETPVERFVEWLAEWGREVRRRQSGLLLLTAHRAKGLEFDHVVVLDGGWGQSSHDEDPDASRRLYYVAMTRARKTLALAQFEGSCWPRADLQKNRSVLHCQATRLPPDSAELHFHHVTPTLENVDLSFAGRQNSGRRTHRAIAELNPGDPLNWHFSKNGRFVLLDRKRTVVGRMAKKFEAPSGKRCRSAKVLAIVRRNREASKPEFQERLKCESWEVVVPEFVFEPPESTIE